MARTPLLLAFGVHPGSRHGIPYSADRKFFRDVTIPFIEGHSGRKAVIIHEYNIGCPSETGLQGDVHSAAYLQRYASLHQEHVRKMLEDSVNVGLNPDPSNRSWFDWGCLDEIIAMNSSRPGSVFNTIEQLSGTTLSIMREQSLLNQGFRLAMPRDAELAVEISVMKKSVEVAFNRNRRLVRFVESLRQEDSERAIVIMRGYAHLGMAKLFDHLDYEMTVVSHHPGAPYFSSEAIIASFGRDLPEQEWVRYGTLSLDYWEHFDSKMKLLIEKRAFGTDPEKNLRILASVGLEAREYALSVGKLAAKSA
jgi:hypothetical protein